MPIETPLLDLHRAAGAEVGEYFGTLLPVRFGDFKTEYDALRNAVALVDTNFQAFFSFAGPDAQRYLNALLTSNVRDLKPGHGTVGLLLTPQGHILAEVGTLMLPDRILAISHAMARERTFSTFDKFIIMDDVTLEDMTPSTGTLELVGSRLAALMTEVSGVNVLDLAMLGHVETTVGAISCRLIRHEFAGIPSVSLVGAREDLPTLWRKLEAYVREWGGAAIGMEALNALRLESGIPWFGQDYGDKNIPHEAGLERSHISYEKGCYTGQEIVERVRSRGHANRRLTSLKFYATEPPAPGAKLVVPGDGAGAEVGHITSTAFSPALGQPIGLGYVRREHSAIGTQLDAAGTVAEVISPTLQINEVVQR